MNKVSIVIALTCPKPRTSSPLAPRSPLSSLAATAGPCVRSRHAFVLQQPVRPTSITTLPAPRRQCSPSQNIFFQASLQLFFPPRSEHSLGPTSSISSTTTTKKKGITKASENCICGTKIYIVAALCLVTVRQPPLKGCQGRGLHGK